MESAVRINEIIGVLGLIDVPPFSCVAPGPLPLFNRESMMLAGRMHFSLKTKILKCLLSASPHCKYSSPFLLSNLDEV